MLIKTANVNVGSGDMAAFVVDVVSTKLVVPVEICSSVVIDVVGGGEGSVEILMAVLSELDVVSGVSNVVCGTTVDL